MKSKLWMVCHGGKDNALPFLGTWNGCDKFLILENPKRDPNCKKFDFVIRTYENGYLVSNSYLDRTTESDLKNIDGTCKKCKHGLRFVLNKCGHAYTFTEFKENRNER